MDARIAKTIVKKCLGYKKGERFLIICDEKLRGLASRFYEAARREGVECVLECMAPRKTHGEEPTSRITDALKKADCAILLTSMSLSHTKARKVASKKHGVRIASLPGVTEKILERAIPINYDSLREKAAGLCRILTKARTVEIRTRRGTNLRMSIKGRKCFSDDGLYAKKGAFGNLPAGEVCIAPVEGTTNGRLVIDGSAPFAGKVKIPKEIVIKDGYAKNMPFPEIRKIISSIGKNALNVAELGIGLNPRAIVTGNILEDEKARGTAHIAFGNNISFGGRVSCPSHLDLVFLNPIILVDGKRLKVYN